MKHNSVWGKLLLLALSFVLAFSTLVSCTKDDIDALDKETDEIKTSLSTTAEDLANLKTLVNSIKATADAAAAKTALDAAIADLEAVKTTADAAATAAALAEAKAAIEAAYASADAAVKTELETAINAVKATADAAAKAADLTAAKAALEAAIADKADKAALDAAIANINALLDEQVTAEDVAAAVKVVDDKLADYAKAADVATLTTTLNDVAAKVEAIATDVETLKAQVAALQAAIADKTDVNDIKAQLVVINAAIEALQGDSNKFADEYELASRVLFGELVVYVVDGECFAVEADKVPEGVTANLRSIDAFKALVASVKDADYADGVLDEFKAIAATQEFFLGRAISVEAIEKCFAAVETEKGSLETLVETLERVLYKDSCNIVLTPTHNCDKTDGTHTEYCIKSVEKVYNKIVANNIEISDKLEARYDLLVAAYNNMVAAEAASEAIENMVLAADATVLYRDKASVLPAVEAYDNFKGTYFGADKLAYTVFYGPSSVTAEDLASALIANYDVMRKHEARLYELEEAGKAAATLNASFTSAEWYDEQRPLYTKAATLADEVKAFKAWIAEYTLEEVNVERIVNDKYEILCVASDYATAMNTIWDTYNEKGVKTSIIDAIAALKGAEDVTKTLITEKDAVAAIRVLVDGLEVAIKAVDINNDQVADWTTKDGNFAKMVGDLANFVAIEERIDELVTAKNLIAELAEDIADFWDADNAKYNVGFSDYDAIKAIEAVKDADVLVAGIDWVCENYDIAKSDVAESNYMLIVDATQKAYDKLFAAYEELTAELRLAYDAAMKILNNEAYNAEYPIPYANESIKAIQIVADAITKYSVQDADIKLPGVDGGAADEVNFTSLLLKLSQVAVNIASKGAAAEAAYAADVAGLIAAMKDLDAKMLDSKAAIDAAYEAIVEWAVDYLGVAADATDAQIKAAVAAIQGMMKYDGKKNDKAFALLSSADLDMVIAAKDTAKATYDAAKAEWDVLKVEIDRLTAMTNGETYSIHTKDAFAAGEKAYNDYRAKYYVASSVLSLFGEVAEKAEFDATYDAFNTFYGEAEDLADEIIDRINALPADLDEYLDVSIADATLTEADAIIVLINSFNARFDKDDACNKWFVVDGEDLILAVYKAKFMAQTMLDVDAASLAAADAEFIHSLYVVQLMSNATTKASVESYYTLAKSDIAAKVATYI